MQAWTIQRRTGAIMSIVLMGDGSVRVVLDGEDPRAEFRVSPDEARAFRFRDVLTIETRVTKEDP